MSQGKREATNTNNNKILGLIIILLLIVLIAVIFLKGNNGSLIDIGSTKTPKSSMNVIEFDQNATEGGIEHKSKEEIQKELNEKVAQGMINISMNTNPVFEDGQSEGNLLIVNSERNNYPQVVYIVFKDDPTQEIYRSGAIPVGSKIENAKLNVDLEPGTYECVAYFNNVDMESNSFVGTAGAEITITVKN